MFRSLLILATASLAACQSKTLEIESDTQWSGSVGGTSSRTIDGSGNSSVDIDANDTICWDFQKQTQGGRLRVYAKVHSITGNDRDGDETTTAQFGIASGCTG